MFHRKPAKTKQLKIATKFNKCNKNLKKYLKSNHIYYSLASSK